MLFQNIKEFIIEKLKLVFAITVIAIVAIVIIVNRINSKIQYNDEYVNGNTAGNLYNGGYFCEKDGVIYFANPDATNRNFDALIFCHDGSIFLMASITW